MDQALVLLAQQGSSDQAASQVASNADSVIERVGSTLANLVEHMDILTRPDDLIALLQNLGIVWGGIMLVVGVLCVLNGYRWHRWVIIVSAFFCGFGMGMVLSSKMEQPYLVAGALALMAAVVANPLLRFSVAFFGGLTGAFIGSNVWSVLDFPQESHWAGALMGLILVGMASFLMFRHVVVLFTSIGGSALAVSGALTMMLYVPSMREGVARMFSGNQILIPLLITVAAVIGLVLQEGQARADVAATNGDE